MIALIAYDAYRMSTCVGVLVYDIIIIQQCLVLLIFNESSKVTIHVPCYYLLYPLPSYLSLSGSVSFCRWVSHNLTTAIDRGGRSLVHW